MRPYPPDSLGAQLNRVVELRFSDGEVVEAKLLAIDPDDHEDVTYEVVRVVSAGNPPARGTEVGATVIAELHELEEWRLLE
jgi:hypothetical protein